MGFKYNCGNGSGICDKCSVVLWTGFYPNVTSQITPYNFYKNGEMYCKKCNPYLKAGISKNVEKTYGG
jgi:RNase P subunit RPR2